MNNFNSFSFVLICLICILMDLVFSSSLKNNLDILKREYGEGYGTEWIYFPDGYGNLHCINLSITMQDETIIDQLRSDSMTDKIEFRLYNGNDNPYILLDKRGRAVNDSEQDATTSIMRSHQPLKIITHGWGSSADIESILNIKNAYITAQNCNVITIDWSCIASSFLYPWVASETKHVGGLIGLFLDGLNEEYNVTGDLLHLIGHSLGAHVVGIAASQTKSTVHRVTGLDPARPFFEFPSRDASEKIGASDAEIVDVIHTSSGFYGCMGALGTVDFYPNGGSAPQPGCGSIIMILDACSHSMSYNYLLESIKDPTIYPAYECESWQDFKHHRCRHTGYMGEGVNKNMTGTYYLTTNATKLIL